MISFNWIKYFCNIVCLAISCIKNCKSTLSLIFLSTLPLLNDPNTLLLELSNNLIIKSAGTI